MLERRTDPFHALGEVVRTPELRAAGLEVVAWYVVGWTVFVGCVVGEVRPGLAWIGALVPIVLVAYPIARLQVRVIAERNGQSGNLGVGPFLAIAFGSLLPALGAAIALGIASAFVLAAMTFLAELDRGYSSTEGLALFLGAANSLLCTAVVLEFRGLAMLGVAEGRPWFGEALAGCAWGALPTGRSLKWILALALIAGIIGSWLFDLDQMMTGYRMYRPMGTLAWFAALSALATVGWPVYLAASRPPAGVTERPAA